MLTELILTEQCMYVKKVLLMETSVDLKDLSDQPDLEDSMEHKVSRG